MRRGFTLIELLVVISIISLLSSVVLASLNSARDKARVSAGRQFAAHADRVAGEQAIGIWDFDECSGTTAVDRSGFGNSGALTNMEAGDWSADTPSGTGCSLALDGVDERVNVATYAAMNPGTDDFSLSMWVKTSAASTDIIRGANGNAGTFTQGYELAINPAGSICSGSTSPRLYFAMANGTTREGKCSNATISDGLWHHVAVSVKRLGNVNIYIDGRLDSSSSSSLSGSVTLSMLAFGGPAAFWSYLPGSIDSVRIFAKDLSVADVGRLYAEGAAARSLAAE